MQRETNTTINIEEVGEFGVVDIAAANVDDINAAIAKIKAITQVPEVGETYKGVVKSILPFGAFIEFIPGQDGMMHISEMEYRRLESFDGILSVGDEIEVKLIAIDEKTGKYKLSHKALLPKPEGYVEPERKPRPSGNGNGGGHNGGPRGNHPKGPRKAENK
jgi:polyribonucleotide nucleotidyltransferase